VKTRQHRLVVLKAHAKVSHLTMFLVKIILCYCAVAESTSLKEALDVFSKFIKLLSVSNYAIKRDDAGRKLLTVLM